MSEQMPHFSGHNLLVLASATVVLVWGFLIHGAYQSVRDWGITGEDINHKAIIDLVALAVWTLVFLCIAVCVNHRPSNPDDVAFARHTYGSLAGVEYDSLEHVAVHKPPQRQRGEGGGYNNAINYRVGSAQRHSGLLV